jgi:hypothetical protein
MTLRAGRRAKNIDASGRDWVAEQGLTYQIVDGDYELPNRRNTKRQPRGGQDLLGQRHQCSGRALIRTLNELRRDRAQMAPAFLFVDPYGFKIPAGLLGGLMKAGRVELFINVMWRELDMLVQQRPAPGTPHAQTLDEIFGSGSWRTEVIGDGMDARLDRAIPLMARGAFDGKGFVGTRVTALAFS